ncbi:MAG: gamma carbonic anhydrase family protein [Proteobacteria bacterium]|nr:MAG: gamma carbonic anhydrase family protein [Pseudomonadota bacterium]QKK12350.1 MAG: gamma carbonic anhydrase family protein [Pseudomonadota bacterium]
MTNYGPKVMIHDNAYIHQTTQIYGDVTVGEGVSFWPYSVVRAEVNAVRIGCFSNIQDFVMIHTCWEGDTVIGDYCSITHHVILHGCTIGNNCLVGINAVIMDNARVGDNCIIAPGSIVREGTVIPDNSIVAGTPAVVKRTRNNFVDNKANALTYWHNAKHYRQGLHRAWTGADFSAEAATTLAALRVEYAVRYGDG